MDAKNSNRLRVPPRSKASDKDPCLPDREESSSSSSDVAAVGRSPSLKSVEALPELPTGTLQLWEKQGVVAARGVLTRTQMHFVALHAARGGSWLHVTVDRSSTKGVKPFWAGFRLSTTESPNERSRFLMTQPSPGDPSRIYFRASGGQDPHMGWLLFIGQSLCERATCQGKAGSWERLELRPLPNRYEDKHCFQMWSHKHQLPVCWSVSHRTGRDAFVLPKRPNFSNDIVVFTLRDFDTDLARTENPRRSNSDPGVFTRITRSTIAFAWGAGNMFTRFNLIGHIGNRLSRPSASYTFHSLQDENALVDESPFELLGVSVTDAATGEALDVGVVVRGSRRIETVRFIAKQDLKNIVRTVVVKRFGLRFTEKVPMGDFTAREEPHEFSFEEKTAPGHAPAGTWNIDLTYSAVNVSRPLYKESTKFVMR